MDVSTLKGKALKDMAAELDIPNRSKLSASALREAIQAVMDRFSGATKGIPLTSAKRMDNYARQRNTTRLTARQRRRTIKKANQHEGGLFI